MPSSLQIVGDTGAFENYAHFLASLYDSDHSIHQLEIVTAYWDFASIEQITNWAYDVRNRGRNVRFALFINSIN